MLGLQFVDGIKRADRDNAIDVYISDEYMDVLADGVWKKTFKVKPGSVLKEEQKEHGLIRIQMLLGSRAHSSRSVTILKEPKRAVLQ